MARRRTKGNGSVRKRGNRWQARITTPEGQELSATFGRKTDAENWLTDVKADILRGEFVLPSDITLGEWIKEWLATYKQSVAPATKSYHLNCLLRLQTHCPGPLHTPLQQLKPPDLQKAVNHLQEIYSPRTTRMTIGFTRSALRKAVALNLIRTNPADGLELPSQVTINGGKLIPPEQMAAILHWCKSSDKSQSVQAYKDLILFLLRHGCRPGEARAIRTDRIKGGWITIDRALDRNQNLKDTKTHMSRRVPIALDCLGMVERRAASSVNGWLFESSTGSPLRHRKLAKVMADLTEDKFSPYDLRHTFCTNAVASGKNLKAIAAITGHSVEMLLRHYVHVTDKDLLEVISKDTGQILDSEQKSKAF